MFTTSVPVITKMDVHLSAGLALVTINGTPVPVAPAVTGKDRDAVALAQVLRHYADVAAANHRRVTFEVTVTGSNTKAVKVITDRLARVNNNGTRGCRTSPWVWFVSF